MVRIAIGTFISLANEYLYLHPFAAVSRYSGERGLPTALLPYGYRSAILQFRCFAAAELPGVTKVGRERHKIEGEMLGRANLPC